MGRGGAASAHLFPNIRDMILISFITIFFRVTVAVYSHQKRICEIVNLLEKIFH